MQEDFVLLRKKEAEGQYCFVAGAACFSFDKEGLRGQNGFMKLGEPLNYIHTSVPGFTKMAHSVDNFFDSLTAEMPKWRNNWFLEDCNSDGTYHYSKFETEVLEPEKKKSQNFLVKGNSQEGAMYDTTCPPKDLFLHVEHQTIHRMVENP